MKNKLLINLLFFFILSSFACAITIDDATTWYSFDNSDLISSNPIDVSGNGNNGTNSGVLTNKTLILREAFEYDTNSDFVNVTHDIYSGDDFSLSMWFSTDILDANFHRLAALDDGSGNDRVFGLSIGNDDKLFGRVINSAGGVLIDCDDGNALSTNTTYHLVFTFEESTNSCEIFLNNVSRVSATGGVGNTIDSTSTNFLIGQLSGQTQALDGKIDEFAFYNKLLNASEINALYNNGNAFNPYFAGIQNFKIYAYSNWTGSSMQNFSVEFNNNGTIYNTTNGIIITNILDNSTSLWNITILSNNRFNSTFTNYNVSNNLNSSMIQSVYNFSVQTAIGLVPQTNFTITLNGTTVCNTTTTLCNLSYPDAGIYEVIVDSLFDNFNTLNTTLNVSALDNLSYFFNVTQFILNITAIDITTNTSISNFSTSLIHLAHYPDHIFNSSTTNGWISYETEEDIYNLTIDAPGYALFNNTVTLNITGNLNYTFYLYTSNSVNFSFYDEDTLNLLNGTNISFSLIYSTGADNYTTSTGFKYLDNLTTDDFEIKYSASGYDSRSFFFTVNERSTQTINLYLSDSNETTLYIIRVADESDADVVGAKVQLQRQYVELDGQYITIEECDTDSDGECDMFIQESSEIEYRFRVIIDDEIVKTTTPQNIVNIAGENKIITLRISSGLGIFQAYEDIEGLFSNITYDNNTGNITYYFLDSKNTITRGCLIIQKSTIRNISIENVAETCFNGFSGTLTYNISSILGNNTIIYAKGVVDFTNERKYLQTLTISNFINPPNIEDKEFLLFNAFIFIVVALSIILIRNVLLQIFLDFGVIIGLWIIGFNRFGLSLIIGFMVLGFILNWNNKSTSSGGGL